METQNIMTPSMGNVREHLEGGHQIVWRSRTCVCQRHTFRGVRGADVDVLVDNRITPEYTGPVRMEATGKDGRYDGAIRLRLVFRLPDRSDQHHYEYGLAPLVFLTPGSLIFQVESISGGLLLDESYQRLITEIDRTDEPSLVRMLTVHAAGKNGQGGYFRHLDSDTVDSCAAEFVAEVLAHPLWTKIEAYQAAGRILYRESRNLGYRKLTLREKRKLNVPADAGQWQKSDRLYSSSGCGEATLTGIFD